MSTIILIITVTILFLLGTGILIWSVFYVRRLSQNEETATKPRKEARLPFHRGYIMLLAGTFLLTIITAALLFFNYLLG